jgi:hypothetical protein
MLMNAQEIELVNILDRQQVRKVKCILINLAHFEKKSFIL